VLYARAITLGVGWTKCFLRRPTYIVGFWLLVAIADAYWLFVLGGRCRSPDPPGPSWDLPGGGHEPVAGPAHRLDRRRSAAKLAPERADVRLDDVAAAS
jgi:hypothetical protein